MLKLEKVAKSRDFNVILRHKPSLLSYYFLLALSYALFCHLIALILFDVGAFKVSYNATILPPITVASDKVFIGVTSDWGSQKPLPSYLIPPSSPLPQLPVIAMEIPRPQEISKQDDSSENLFLALEDKIEVDPLTNLLSEKKGRRNFLIRCCGGLNESNIIINEELIAKDIPNFLKANPSLHSSDPYQFYFSVAIEEQSGQIFWWDCHQASTENKELRSLAIHVLKQLRFDQQSLHAVNSGNIEISILLNPV
jgi:hypothetical protein